jgi:DNA-binding GntR family transcriptional regulator
MLGERPPYFDECWINHDALVAALVRRDADASREVKVRDLRALQALVEATAGAPR